jgi:hypothetical protein
MRDPGTRSTRSSVGIERTAEVPHHSTSVTGWEVEAMRVFLAALVVASTAVVAASPAGATQRALVRVSGESPFAPGCNGAPQTGTVYRNSEVEPSVDASPENPRNLVAVWQQDRWSSGAAQGNLGAYSFDGGRSWRRSVPPPFSRCAGGTAANGGDYERASDPWVSFSPNGTAHQSALAVNNSDDVSAILVSSSRDGGRTWGPVKTLARNSEATLQHDKETLTADPTDSRFVYAVWGRIQTGDPNDPTPRYSGDAMFARSTDGGRTWEPARAIVDFPDDSNLQSFGQQIAVLGDGTLVNVFTLIDDGETMAAVQRSFNRGRTWSEPIVIERIDSSVNTPRGGVIDPADGRRVRTGDLLLQPAADPRSGWRTMYLVWQDLRFAAPGPFENDQVVLVSSTDGGRTWTDPRRVSGNRRVQGFTGTVQVDRHGRVGVTYYDFTHDDPSGGPLDTDHWFTASRDGGLTFSPRERLTDVSFDMRAAPVAGGFFVGDYVGLTSVGRPFVSAFAVSNGGNPSNPTDIVSTPVR